MHGEHSWVLVLAAGEGRRLQGLTTTASGTVVPKQYCSLLGGPSLLEEAYRTAELLFPAIGKDCPIFQPAAATAGIGRFNSI